MSETGHVGWSPDFVRAEGARLGAALLRRSSHGVGRCVPLKHYEDSQTDLHNAEREIEWLRARIEGLEIMLRSTGWKGDLPGTRGPDDPGSIQAGA